MKMSLFHTKCVSINSREEATLDYHYQEDAVVVIHAENLFRTLFPSFPFILILIVII